VIFVKAFSEDDLKVAQAAQRRRIPVVLDICDNIFVEGYSSFGARPETFKKMASIAGTIVTTGSGLAHVLRKELGAYTRVVVVPDGVETATDREQIVILLAEKMFYGRTARACFRFRGQAREQSLMLAGSRAVIRQFGKVADWLGSVAGPRIRLVTDPVRTSYRKLRGGAKLVQSQSSVVVRRVRENALVIRRKSRRGARQMQDLWKIVIRRVGEDGPLWIIRGIVRRTRRIVGKVGGASTALAVAPDVSSVGVADKPGPILPIDGGTLAASVPCAPNNPAILGAECALKERTLIWFGNHGARYGRFGLVDLADRKSALCTIAERHRIRLIVVSNSEARFNELIRPLPFPTYYVPWRSGVVEELLEESEVALIPNSLDAFSVCKSANRAVLALHHGVPVVATRTPALVPLADCVIFDDWIGGIEAYLNDPRLVRQHVAAARTIIEWEFSGKRIAADWDAILQCVCAGSEPTRARDADSARESGYMRAANSKESSHACSIHSVE
jgi:glycosyltransferase involved in cell wall biosynthesis